MHVLTCVTGRVDCFGCVCVPPRLKDKVRFVLQYMSTYGHVLFVNLLVSYAVVRQISMLFIDNKDCVFCILYESVAYIYIYMNCFGGVPCAFYS